MSKRWPISLPNKQQVSNNVGVEQLRFFFVIFIVSFLAGAEGGNLDVQH